MTHQCARCGILFELVLSTPGAVCIDCGASALEAPRKERDPRADDVPTKPIVVGPAGPPRN
ncbi:MAG TPA: hypothetical protein VMY76_04210 [Gemmatimonadales bacterium]|nr:hypothetical protein [Gemmatimonadales bacterium]